MPSLARMASTAGAVAALLLVSPTGSELYATTQARDRRVDTSHACKSAGQWEAVSTPAETPMYGVRAASGAAPIMAFLHGLCSRPEFAHEFQAGAVAHGTLLAPKGDVPCPSRPGSTWSNDLEALDRRLGAGLATLGFSKRRDIVLIGHSLGATRAEELARKFPDRYTRLILIGGPRVPSAAGLARLRGAVLIAGEHDRQDLMRRGATILQSAGVRSTFMELPAATHREMGPEGNRVISRALSWLLPESSARAETTVARPCAARNSG
jgi:predicted esterase